jgi:hypothetical protein
MAKSIPTVTGDKTLGGKITIKTNRDNSNYTHTLRYSWGSQIEDEFIAENITDSYTWTIPKELANYIITATKGTMVLKLLTFNGSEYIGSSPISFTVTMPDTAEFNPKINDIVLEEIGTPTNGLWMQKQSRIKGTLVITNAYGTSALNYKVSANGAVYTTRIFETDVLINNGNMDIVAIYTDKRGRKATFTKTINIQAYDYPHIESASVTRINSTSAKLSIVGSISDINNTNTKSFYYKYKLKTATNYGSATAISNDTYTIDKTITVSGLQDAEYDFLVGIQDAYGIAEKKEIHLPSSYRLFNISKDKKKFAFFGKAVKEGLQVFGKIYDRFGYEMQNGVALWEINGIDANTSLEELFVSRNNAPTSQNWYIRTIFSNGKSISTPRMQVAYPYNQDTPYKQYYRYFDNGSWSDWVAFGGSAAGNGILKIGDDICIQYGSLSVKVDTGNTAKNITFNFNTPFSTCYEMIPILETSAVTGCQVARGAITASTGSIWFNRTNTSATNVKWIAIGKLR